MTDYSILLGEYNFLDLLGGIAIEQHLYRVFVSAVTEGSHETEKRDASSSESVAFKFKLQSKSFVYTKKNKDPCALPNTSFNFCPV